MNIRNFIPRSCCIGLAILVLMPALPDCSAGVKSRKPVRFVTHGVGQFRSEACCVGDFNNDGDLDIVVTGKWGGPVYFENKSKSN